ncbi:hypothetical protein N7454_003605 [Penicillium verhagenii]|nr:hypothetical protein N7454_003605 [Penicillium verhagenii]
MDANTLSHASTLFARADSSSRPSYYKAIGVSLAVASGVFIGVSFVLKKIGLLRANVKYNEEAGEGYGYLKNVLWWSGMTLMIIGEICNFVAYAFVDAILVTPSVLSIFLKERLSFVGKVGCFSCIIGSVVIAMNAPQQSSVSNIQEMQHYVIAPGFLTYAGVIIVGSVFTAFWAGPRYGKQSMFVYISICSMVGGLSVVATQGLGSAIIAWIGGEPQYKEWFLWVLFAFVICTLLTEIIFLNKALNLFNAALVTPTYYVMFTSATIVTSAILFQGFKGTATEISTVIMGFLQICTGVVLLQISKSAKDVPDAAVFKGDLDQIREVVTQEEPESEPRADSIRGAASIIRRISTARRTMESDEARRFFHDKHEDTLKPPGENEIIEWDGIRRRKTVLGEGPTMSRTSIPRTPSVRRQLPPLGMSHFPDPEDDDDHRPSTKQSGHSFLSDIRSRTSSLRHPQQWIPLKEQDEKPTGAEDAAVTQDGDIVDTEYHGASARHIIGRERSDTPRSIAWADEKPDDNNLEPPRNTARRQFSFNSMLGRMRVSREPSPKRPTSPPRGILRRPTNQGTEEERLGLVKGDSRTAQPEESLNEKLDRWSSGESEHKVEPQPLRTHRDSVSSMSTAAFPPYEDHHHAMYHNPGASASNPYYLPPIRQAESPEQAEEYEGWQLPPSSARGHNRTRTNSSSHARAPPPSQSSFSTHRHPNPLPPLPDDTAVGVRSIPSDSSDMGVASMHSSTEGQDPENTRPSHMSRQNSGWRRHMSELSSHNGEEPYEEHRGNGHGGAFV